MSGCGFVLCLREYDHINMFGWLAPTENASKISQNIRHVREWTWANYPELVCVCVCRSDVCGVRTFHLHMLTFLVACCLSTKPFSPKIAAKPHVYVSVNCDDLCAFVSVVGLRYVSVETLQITFQPQRRANHSMRLHTFPSHREHKKFNDGDDDNMRWHTYITHTPHRICDSVAFGVGVCRSQLAPSIAYTCCGQHPLSGDSFSDTPCRKTQTHARVACKRTDDALAHDKMDLTHANNLGMRQIRLSLCVQMCVGPFCMHA